MFRGFIVAQSDRRFPTGCFAGGARAREREGRSAASGVLRMIKPWHGGGWADVGLRGVGGRGPPTRSGTNSSVNSRSSLFGTDDCECNVNPPSGKSPWTVKPPSYETTIAGGGQGTGYLASQGDRHDIFAVLKANNRTRGTGHRRTTKRPSAPTSRFQDSVQPGLLEACPTVGRRHRRARSCWKTDNVGRRWTDRPAKIVGKAAPTRRAIADTRPQIPSALYLTDTHRDVPVDKA